MSSSDLGVGVVGLGFGANVHVPGWRLLAPLGVRLAAVCARDGEQAAQVAAAAGVPSAFRDWRELVEDERVSIVSVASPPATHREIVIAALRARKAVLCEKPLGLDSSEAAELAAAAETAGVPALVNFSYRAVPAFRYARGLVERGDLGRILRIEVSWHVGTRLGALTPSWKDHAAAGGGALASFAVHALDYVEWLAGPARRVLGRLDTHFAGGDSDDACAILLELASGASALISVSTVSVGGRTHRVELRGERGRLTLENLDPRDHVRPFTATAVSATGRVLPALPPVPPFRAAEDADGRVEPFAAHAAEIVAALREGRSCEPSFASAVRAHRLLDAVRASAGSGRWERVDGETAADRSG